MLTLERKILQAQERLFRLAARDFGLSLKAISLDSGIKYETLRSYAGNKEETAMMPISAVLKLVDVLPDELLSQLFDPVSRCIMPVDGGGEPDLDALGEDADAVATEVRRARKPDSPGGTNIVPIERNAILAKASRFGRRVKAVAA